MRTATGGSTTARKRNPLRDTQTSHAARPSYACGDSRNTRPQKCPVAGALTDNGEQRLGLATEVLPNTRCTGLLASFNPPAAALPVFAGAAR